MSRTSYTSTATYPLAVGWKCTKCGRINAKTCNIKMTATASRQGLSYSRETESQASEQAQNQVMLRVLGVVADAEKRKYGPALYGCVCHGCKHREPWASVKANGRVVAGCFLGSVALGLLALLCILLQDWKSLLCLLGIIAVLVSIAFISMRKATNNTKKLEPIFAQLKTHERPVLAPNAETLREKMYGVFAQGPDDIDKINKAVADEL